MIDQKHSDKIDKLIDKIRKIEAQTPAETTSMLYTTDDIKKLINECKIPGHLGEWYLRYIDDQNRKFREWNNLLRENPDLGPEECLNRFSGFPRSLSIEESVQFYEEFLNIAQIQNIIFNACQDASNSARNKSESTTAQNTTLFKNIPSGYIGISHGIANAMYYLVDLLSTKIEREYGDQWKATGTAKDSYQRDISLVYEFQASSQDDAETKIEVYKKIMQTTGINCWLSYWAVANNHNRPEYTCPLVDIMKCTSNPNRTTRFEPEERQRFWEITKMLQKTKISISRYVRTDKRGTAIFQWVEQPMIEILGGEKEETTSIKYPLTLSVRVLSSQMGTKDFAPTKYKKTTLTLDPADIFLAFCIQTRFGQKNKESEFEWNYFFKRGNLEATSKTNPREAKVKTRRKLARIKKAGIIEGIKENKTGITPIMKPSKNENQL
jgi:hypothetical protein